MQGHQHSGSQYHSSILEKAFAQSDQLVNDVLSSFSQGKETKEPRNSNSGSPSTTSSSFTTRYTSASAGFRGDRRGSPQRRRGMSPEDYEDDLETAAALQEPFVEGFSPQRRAENKDKESLWNTWGSSNSHSSVFSATTTAPRNYPASHELAAEQSSGRGWNQPFTNEQRGGYTTGSSSSRDREDGNKVEDSVLHRYMTNKGDTSGYGHARDPQIETYAKHAKELLQSWLTVENDAAGVKTQARSNSQSEQRKPPKSAGSERAKEGSGKRVAGGGGRFYVPVSQEKSRGRASSQQGRNSSADRGQLVIDTVTSHTATGKQQSHHASSKSGGGGGGAKKQGSNSKDVSKPATRKSRERSTTFRNSTKLSKVYGYNALTPSDKKMMQKLIEKYDDSDSDEELPHQKTEKRATHQTPSVNSTQPLSAPQADGSFSMNTEVGQWATEESDSSSVYEYPPVTSTNQVATDTAPTQQNNDDVADDTPNERNYQDEIQRLRNEASEARKRIDAWKSGSGRPSLFQAATSGSTAQSTTTAQNGNGDNFETEQEGESLLQKLHRLRNDDADQPATKRSAEGSKKSEDGFAGIGQHAAHEKAVRTAELRQKHFNRLLRRVFRAWKSQSAEVHRRKRMDDALNRIDKTRKRNLRDSFEVWKRQLLRTQRINAVAEGKYRFHIYNRVWTAWRRYISERKRQREEEEQERKRRQFQEKVKRADKHYENFLYSKYLNCLRQGIARSRKEREEAARQEARQQQIQRFMQALEDNQVDITETGGDNLSAEMNVTTMKVSNSDVHTEEASQLPAEKSKSDTLARDSFQLVETGSEYVSSAPNDTDAHVQAEPYMEFSSTIPSHSPITTPTKSLLDTGNDLCSWEVKEGTEEFPVESSSSISPVSSFTKLEGSSTQFDVSMSRIGQEDRTVAPESSTVHASSVASARPPPPSVDRRNVDTPCHQVTATNAKVANRESAGATSSDTSSVSSASESISRHVSFLSAIPEEDTGPNASIVEPISVSSGIRNPVRQTDQRSEATGVEKSVVVTPLGATSISSTDQSNTKTLVDPGCARQKRNETYHSRGTKASEKTENPPNTSGSRRIIRGDGTVVGSEQAPPTDYKEVSQHNSKWKSRVKKNGSSQYPQKTKVHKEIYEKVNRADIFRRLTLLKKYGISQLRDLVRNRHLREQKAESHFREQLLEKTFCRLRQWTKNERYRRKVQYIQVRKRRLRQLLRRSFQHLKSIYSTRQLEHRMQTLSTKTLDTISVYANTSTQGASNQATASSEDGTAAPGMIGGLQKTTTEVATVTDSVKELAKWADEFRNGKLGRRSMRAWKCYYRRSKRSRESKQRQEQMMEEVKKWLSGSTLD